MYVSLTCIKTIELFWLFLYIFYWKCIVSFVNVALSMWGILPEIWHIHCCKLVISRLTCVDYFIGCCTCYLFTLCLWLLHLCGLLLQKLCMSCCVVCLKYIWDYSLSSLDSLPPSPSAVTELWHKLHQAFARHANFLVQRQSKPLACATNKELRHIFNIMETRPSY